MDDNTQNSLIFVSSDVFFQVHGMQMIMNYEDVDFMKVWGLSQLEAFRSGVMPRLIQVCQTEAVIWF